MPLANNYIDLFDLNLEEAMETMDSDQDSVLLENGATEGDIYLLQGISQSSSDILTVSTRPCHKPSISG